MRLICGFLHCDDKPAEAARLAAMVAAMIEPGLTPRVASFSEGPVALATLEFLPAALRTRPPSAAILPRSPSGIVLAADVRLYERAKRQTDEATLLDAIERGGADSCDAGLGGVFGDFALAAWNPRDQVLLCSRDGVGVRPLFVADQPGRAFAFASLPRGLLASGLLTRELDAAALLSNLLMRATPDDRSVFRGVKRLAPGSWLRVSARRRLSGTHWRLDSTGAGQNRCRPEQAAEEMVSLVSQAVCDRLPETGPVATHLSGGLDSPSIAVIAARALRDSGRSLFAYPFLPTQQGGFAPDGEGLLVQSVLDQEPDIVSIPARIGPSLDFLLPRMDCDQPLPFDPADPDAWICMDAAARGAQVLFTGWGGDQGASFNGRGALAEALLTGRWVTLAREIRARSLALGCSMSYTVRGDVLNYLLPEAVQTFVQRLRGRKQDDPPTIIARLLRGEAMAGVAPPAPSMGPNAVANRLILLRGEILTRRAEQWALTGARTGIAATFPLLDRRVLEFALSLPSSLFLRGGITRRLYRDAMIGVLPNKILAKLTKDTPFAESPLIVAVQRDALLARLPELRKHDRVNGLFDLDALGQRLRALPAPDEAWRGARNLGDSPELRRLVAMLPRVLRFVAYVQQHH